MIVGSARTRRRVRAPGVPSRGNWLHPVRQAANEPSLLSRPPSTSRSLIQEDRRQPSAVDSVGSPVLSW